MTKINQVAVVVPAAGVGRRMQSAVPKQYLQLGHQTVLQWTLAAVTQDPRVAHVYVALHPDDPYFSELECQISVPMTGLHGGATRAASVAAGVAKAHADGFAWVAVHDAARPCLSAGELTEVLDVALSDDVGAILALPVADTLKRATPEDRIAGTVAREQLWQALTPQVFPSEALLAGFAQLGVEHPALTDEASVFEALGQAPKLVVGRRTNLKITLPGDEALAQLILMQSHQQA
ncbi:2-C-methyl-D-erythritol 4-phosphate cytidylyltransferase [Pseudidiomarina sediminum]|uniref:2-C-methyl-D-erythritol 4-phosphate cytidylyltransferase n=1 Tax=Pseudidiomarina sediminum TaxID=431675 RepID=A0A432Z818_9GAMM|nr:2-C-methyl-D-erythritol 4-phosphate cytidylyltransferase [Pseudidiomarina sediminum]RUO74022.1 2-C-methyl-D-erythritol 4-phosphate cytidylyltransferase [Pseudidiomarina sediminum]